MKYVYLLMSEIEDKYYDGLSTNIIDIYTDEKSAIKGLESLYEERKKYYLKKGIDIEFYEEGDICLVEKSKYSFSIGNPEDNSYEKSYEYY